MTCLRPPLIARRALLVALFILVLGAGSAASASTEVDPFVYDAGRQLVVDEPLAASLEVVGATAANPFELVRSRAEPAATPTLVGHVYDVSDDFVAPRQLAAFSRSSIDDAVTSVSRGHNDQISVGARAIDKRLGANSAPFQGIEATTANAQALVTDILESPARTVFGQRTYDVYNAAGQGARFDVSSNRFITFLDETIATR